MTLIVLFVVAYAIKVALIGREALDLWSRDSLLWLRIHETFVLVFLLAGAYAFHLSRKFGQIALLRGVDSVPNPAARWRHARAGRIYLLSFGAALATAAVTYSGIVHRVPEAPMAAGTGGSEITLSLNAHAGGRGSDR